MISGAFSLVNVLADMAGPGTIGISGHNPHFFIVSGLSGFAYLHLHVHLVTVLLAICLYINRNRHHFVVTFCLIFGW